MHRPKRYPTCVASGCNASGNVAHGLCQLHYGQQRLARKKNGSRDEAKREIPPFEYEGDEAALIALAEQQESEQQANDLKAEEN